MKKFLALCFLAGSLTGCSYTAMSVAPDGTLYVAKSTASVVNRIYSCKVDGEALKCAEAGSP